MDRKMFFGANTDLFKKAKQLRENMTAAEKALWNRLRENQLGVRFKPQHPLDIFIADFYCHS
jgi:cyclase